MCKKNVLFMMVAMLMVIMVLPNTAYAKSTKKTLQVTVGSLKKNGKKYEVSPNQKKVKLKVTYGGKNVTKKAKYKSSNKKAFTVSKKGVLTVKGPGTSTITVKYAGKTKKVKVQSRTNKSNSSKSHTHEWEDKQRDVIRYIPDTDKVKGWSCERCSYANCIRGINDTMGERHTNECHPGQTVQGHYRYEQIKVIVKMRLCKGCRVLEPVPGYEDLYNNSYNFDDPIWY